MHHGTPSAPARVTMASAAYLARLHECIASTYLELNNGEFTMMVGGAGSGGVRTHPLLPLMRLSATATSERLALASPLTAPPPRVVLIERMTGSRSVTNAMELRSALEALQPAISLSVFGVGNARVQADNLREFASADVIVGPHGAGQTNGVVSWPGTAQVEFIPATGLSNLVYTQMALLLGEYFTSFTPPGSSYYSTFTVDVPRVVAAVRELVK